LARDDAWVGFETHPQAYSSLKNLCNTSHNMSCHKRDAFEGLPALLPVTNGRALVITDPSYEVKQDYADIPSWLSAAHHKMPQMTIILWYPILPENRHQRMLSSLQQLDCKAYLVSEWHNTQSYQGMKGSGIFIINPPWSIQQSFVSTMDWLSQQHGFTDFNHTWNHKQS
jgi:23S rRNA (adenine2030-N6)-methyltransferase